MYIEIKKHHLVSAVHALCARVCVCGGVALRCVARRVVSLCGRRDLVRMRAFFRSECFWPTRAQAWVVHAPILFRKLFSTPPSFSLRDDLLSRRGLAIVAWCDGDDDARRVGGSRVLGARSGAVGCQRALRGFTSTRLEAPLLDRFLCRSRFSVFAPLLAALTSVNLDQSELDARRALRGAPGGERSDRSSVVRRQ